MRTSILFLLLLSLAANLSFGWRLWVLRHAEPPEAAITPTPLPVGPPAPPPRPLGEQLHTDDPAEFTARLREMGLPPPLLNALVSDRLNKVLKAKLRDLRNENSDAGYWTGSPNLGPDQMRAFLILQSEIESQLRALLGDDFQSNPVHIAELRRRYGSIDPTKLPQLEDIIRDYQSLKASYTTSMFRLPGDNEEAALLEREEQADLAALLSPAELLEYNLHNGNTTDRLRRDLGVLQVSEAEFRQLLPLWQQMPVGNELRRVYDPRIPSTPEEIAARASLVAQATAFLGAERATDLAQALTPQAYAENNFAARAGLPASAATTLYQSRLAAEQLMQGPQNSNSAANDDPVAANARADEARKLLESVTAAIGEENLKLLESNNGYWIGVLRRLGSVPNPAPSPSG